MILISYLLYGLAWAAFGLVHSLLARPMARVELERHLGGWARLAYNLVAAVHLTGVLLFGWWLFDGSRLFDFPTGLRVVMVLVAVAGLVVIGLSLREFQIGRYLGWSQVIEAYRGQSRPAANQLDTGGLYRWLRHPMYSGSILVLWGLAQSPLGVATAIWGTLYLLIGARFEERDLVRQFGDRYRAYQRRVPMFLPRGSSRAEPAA